MTSERITSDVPMGLSKEKTPERLAFDEKIKAYDLADAKYRDGEITFDDIADVYSLTVKEDKENVAIVTALALLNYTDNCQQNLIMKADSSTGKTYLVTEVLTLFPQDDIVKLFNCSPTAFIYEYGSYDHSENVVEVNLHQKILVFLDQKNMDLLAELRPLLSHDAKKLVTKRTDKSKKYGHATKTVRLIGYPTFIVCNASHKILDEQELTRAFQISPEQSQQKFKEALMVITERTANSTTFQETYVSDVSRVAFSERILNIRELHITDIIIPETLKIDIYDNFLEQHNWLTPRNMRDYPRLIALIKAHTLLNAQHRETREINTSKYSVANETDILEGFKLYSYIAESNELGLSPEIYDIWKNIVQPNLTPFLTRTILRQRFFTSYHRNLSNYKAKETLETLVAVGLIVEEMNPENKREKIYVGALTNEQTTIQYINDRGVPNGE